MPGQTALPDDARVRRAADEEGRGLIGECSGRREQIQLGLCRSVKAGSGRGPSGARSAAGLVEDQTSLESTEGGAQRNAPQCFSAS